MAIKPQPKEKKMKKVISSLRWSLRSLVEFPPFDAYTYRAYHLRSYR